MTAESERHPGFGLEVASALVLSISALLTSWAGYQAALWDGEQAASYTQANALRIEASRVATAADTRLAEEIDVFSHWLNAKAQNDEALAQFYQARLPEDLKPAFNAWLAERPLINPSAPKTPFATPQYRRAGAIQSEALNAKADAAFKAGQRANQISDAFTQAATILATALFFGGIGQTFRSRDVRIGLLAMACLAIGFASLRLFNLPLQTLGLSPIG